MIEPDPRVEADWAFFIKETAAAAAKQSHVQVDGQQELQRSKCLAAEATDAIPATGQARCPSGRGNAMPMNIVIINYGSYDNNSAIQITCFANGLTALGHRVVVSAEGSINNAGDLGVPRFRCVPHRLIRESPGILADHFAGTGNGLPDLVHCWTPRQMLQTVARVVVERYRCPYIVHFEDNETAVARAFGSMRKGLGRIAGAELPNVKSLPAIDEFVRKAAGATIIVDALKDLLPGGLPFHLLEPGVNSDLFKPGLDSAERKRLCDALNVPYDTWITVYPGNVHPANAGEVFSLYAAVQALNARGWKVHLIRTGIDAASVMDPRFTQLSRAHVTDLGLVRRDWLVEILKLGDFFVQPGAPGDFNNYRLPSKIPELLAMGRPVVLPRTNIGLRMRHRVDALLMQRGDAAEITECVEALLSDAPFAGRVGQEGRRFAIEHFSWERSTQRLEGFYRRILRR